MLGYQHVLRRECWGAHRTAVDKATEIEGSSLQNHALRKPGRKSTFRYVRFMEDQYVGLSFIGYDG